MLVSTAIKETDSCVTVRNHLGHVWAYIQSYTAVIIILRVVLLSIMCPCEFMSVYT